MEKLLLIHNSAILRHASLRLLLYIAMAYNIFVYILDIKQAYTRSKPTTRLVFFKAAPLFGIDPNLLFQIVRPLYLMADASDEWWRTLKQFLDDEVNLTQSLSDPCLFYLEKEGPPALLGVYVDDMVFTGSPQLRTVTDRIAKGFPTKAMVNLSLRFSGCNLQRDGETLIFQQPDYFVSLLPNPDDATFESFRRLLNRLAWISLTRSDLSPQVNMSAEVTTKSFSPVHVETINKTVSLVTRFMQVVLAFPNPDPATLHFDAYSDESFATNEDDSSQLGFIILLFDGSGRACILSFSSRNSRRVVRSVLGPEGFDFSKIVDEAQLLIHDLQSILKRNILLRPLTDRS